MFKKAATTDTRGRCDALIEYAAARNQAVELHGVNEHNEPVVARTRILAVDAEEILLDRPQSIGTDVEFTVEQPIDMFLIIDDDLFRFKTHIARPHFPVTIRTGNTVVGMTVARPEEALSGQRRNHFRMLLASIDPIEVFLHEAVDCASAAVPIDARQFRGELIDLSIGGAAIRIDGHYHATFRLNESLWLTFRLPGDTEPHTFICKLRQTRDIADTSNCRIGVQFLPWPDQRAFERRQNLLQRFITHLQRERLRRSA